MTVHWRVKVGVGKVSKFIYFLVGTLTTSTMISSGHEKNHEIETISLHSNINWSLLKVKYSCLEFQSLKSVI